MFIKIGNSVFASKDIACLQLRYCVVIEEKIEKIEKIEKRHEFCCIMNDDEEIIVEVSEDELREARRDIASCIERRTLKLCDYGGLLFHNSDYKIALIAPQYIENYNSYCRVVLYKANIDTLPSDKKLPPYHVLERYLNNNNEVINQMKKINGLIQISRLLFNPSLVKYAKLGSMSIFKLRFSDIYEVEVQCDCYIFAHEFIDSTR